MPDSSHSSKRPHHAFSTVLKSEVDTVSTNRADDSGRDLLRARADLPPSLGVNVPTLEEVGNRVPGGVGATRFVGYRPISDDLWKVQQEVADNFYSIELLPMRVDVRNGALTPAEHAALTPCAKTPVVSAISKPEKR